MNLSGYRGKHCAAFLAIVGFTVLLSTECIRSNPVVVDEYAHVPAGVSYWQLGRHFLYRENPPFVRLVTSFPVWLSRPKMDYSSAATTYRSEFQVGRDFIRDNRQYHKLFMLARCASLFLVVGCSVLIFLWAGENFGGPAAVVCASLWLSDPTVIANASIATVDAGASTFGFAATYLFWRFLRSLRWRDAVLAGVGLGVAQASKFSLIVLYPAWLAIMLVGHLAAVTDGPDPARPRGFARWGRFCAICSLSILVLDAIYCFDGVCRPLGFFDFKSHALSGRSVGDLDATPADNRFRKTWLAEWPVPLPEDYVRGIDSQKWEEEIGFYRPSNGNLVHGGNWYSPLLTLVFKLPSGTLALLGVSLLYWAGRSRRFCLADCAVVIPALGLIGLLCVQVGLNWPVRYALPVFPFLALAVGHYVQIAWVAHPLLRCGVLACLLWNGTAVLCARPHFMSYGNDLVGGFSGARREFTGSNFDWGQDL